MADDVRDLTVTEEWFRDRLIKLLGVGQGAFLVMCGWLISNDSVFSLFHQHDAEKHEAAVLLSILLPLAWALWYAALLKAHARCPNHATVIQRRLLHVYTLAIGVGMIVMLIMTIELKIPLPE